MNKCQCFYWYDASLMASLLLNILLVSKIYLHEDGGAASSKKLTWTLVAAAEAEAVASISCSGHGRAYIDGVQNDEGKPVCECNPCYSGSDCSQFDQMCVVDATSGDPLFLEPFWEEHAASSAIVTSGWHRMSYTFPNVSSSVSQELEDHIRKLHAVAKNANTEGKHLIVGVGSTQLLNAAIYALSMANPSSTAKVVASAPYYPVYRDQTNFLKTSHYEFEGDVSSLLKNTTISVNMDNVIEIVTSPNNPDGKLQEPVLQGSFASKIFDHAYYWPQYSAIPVPVDEDLMLFSFSKLTGHAGSRLGSYMQTISYNKMHKVTSFDLELHMLLNRINSLFLHIVCSWAFVKDEKIYQLMNEYIEHVEESISKDTQLRALKLLKVVLAKGKGTDMFNFGYKTMKSRWEKLSEIISLSNRFTLQEIPSQNCTFFGNVRRQSPAYVWLQCEMDEDADCYTVLKVAKILGLKGSKYGATDRHLRLSLIKRQDEFDLLLQRLKELVSVKGGKARL